MDGAWAQASEIAAAVSEGRISAAAVVGAALARIRQLNSKLNAFTDVLGERALERAQAIDRTRAKGPLAGVPFAVKNMFDIAGLATRAGSRINRDRAPATRDATLIARLEAAGAVLVGALNMGEYAYDFTGENVHDGDCRNPHDLTRMTGGSSSGSACAVAAGLTALALGSDTNGSIRVPSSLCGVFGLKPTYGRLSRAGTFPFVASLDHVGPMARSARDLALAYDARLAPTPTIPSVPAGRPYGRFRSLLAASRGCASRSPAAISVPAPSPRRRRRLHALPRRSARRPRSNFPKPRVRARRPTPSLQARAAPCISTACAPARAISIPPCATA